MEKKILECVPNFSEGRDMGVIGKITSVINNKSGVKLLGVEPGRGANRTVVTFAGEPEAVCEAAYQAVRKAAELIDMSKHKGAHPRMGATDVLPLVPVSGVTMDEAVIFARNLARRIGEELGIPVYCYEYAAFSEKRRNLANIRRGGYEGLAKKLADPEWKPDYGPAVFNEKSGATAVGARDFLVAFNVNLDTDSKQIAEAIAAEVREKGKTIVNENGEKAEIPGKLRGVKAIGWYIDEYGKAQVSMNITKLSVTPVHVAFEEVCRKAKEKGVKVTGSELVGLIPLEAMIQAGKYFLKNRRDSDYITEEELIKVAIDSMGMSEIHEFRVNEKILEYVMEKQENKF